MKLIMAAPRGFCAGVERALKIVDEALELMPHPIYVNHEIVHNSHVVDYYKKKGVVFVEDIKSVPDGASFIFNAHGVPPSLVKASKDRGMKVVDATCPLVSKVHFEAIRYAKQGYKIILIGHEGHSEVIGVMGEAPDSIFLVETPEDVDKLTFSDEDKIAYITQTTLSVDDCAAIIAALKKRYPNVSEPKKADICYATTNRQEAVKKIAEQCDVFIIVGSTNSSNSNRLREVAQAGNDMDAYLVNCAESIDPRWFDGKQVLGLSAGASTPEKVVSAVVDRLKSECGVNEVSEFIAREESEHFALPKIRA
ncbi:4-hydroxy-3-methylbut-2-enyl diphosphate reductase [Lentisphaera profundi]|uniref:4-hydroxy-3-methylbut-2-enyl diphosphate reductase n=1 Tax=Lentisphaera profundi TaxID=1658616 RepID=A0ABY7VYT3_9BACT|nr:4-hydroxy-3-methylbut-2-enyl diphosphate reductase [Lentisphaera profundi]WDE97946.1 4-hydroxy-3-methylbut-2-enyl diphosphate reductase [Lentisphaera profundi]